MSTPITKPALLAALVAVSTGALTARSFDHAAPTAQALPPIACAITPDGTVPIAPAAGRTVYCGLDIGSRTIKLSVISMVAGQNATVRDERICRRTLGMGVQVFDSATRTAKPLPSASIDNLSSSIAALQSICRADRGTVVSAGATQWARDATNIAEVKARVKAATGLEFDVLLPLQEAEFGYVAASVNAPGRIVLDPGSNSFQIAWKTKTGRDIHSVLVEYGYVRAAAADFQPATDYTSAVAAYRAKARTQIAEALAHLTPPTDLAALAGLVRSGELGPELVSLGQDGSVHWAVRGNLRDNGVWIADQSVYDARVAKSAFITDPAFGVMAAAPIPLPELQAYLRGLAAPDFAALKADPAKGLYGQRALVTPALMELLMTELGLRRLIIVPQEITTGQILARLSK